MENCGIILQASAGSGWVNLLFIAIIILVIYGFYRLNTFINEREDAKEQATANQRRKQREAYLKECQESYDTAYAAMANELEEPIQDIIIDEYDDEYDIRNHIFIYEVSKKIAVNAKLYSFDDILGCSLVNDATSETITTSIGKAKTSTGSMVGRAVVGGVLTGGLGAVAGAATAKKNISTDATSLTTTTHKYTIYVNVDSLENPTVTIRVGEDAHKAHKIANLFNVIIERTNKLNKQV